jgi:hypothetical protein
LSARQALAARIDGDKRAEVVLLGCDLLALLSFLPLHAWFAPSTFRLLRLTRLLLLVGYWGDMLGDLWHILSGRERRHQLLFVLLVAVVLSFAGAALVAELAPAFDYDGDGDVDHADRTFRGMQWWALRQSLDPGNTPSGPPGAVVATVSLGTPRRFQMRPTEGGRSLSWNLGSGDLFVMGGTAQRTWRHGVPKVAQAAPRLAVMFRPSWGNG